jgi:hypothetical protein
MALYQLLLPGQQDKGNLFVYKPVYPISMTEESCGMFRTKLFLLHEEKF